MLIGLTKETWIESLALKTQDEYLQLVDNLVIVTDRERENEPPFYFVKGDYDKIKSLLQGLALCKAYPQRTWFTVNFSLYEIQEGVLPSDIRREWQHELQTRKLV